MRKTATTTARAVDWLWLAGEGARVFDGNTTKTMVYDIFLSYVIHMDRAALSGEGLIEDSIATGESVKLTII